MAAGGFKDVADVGFRLAVVLGHYLRAGDVQEVRVGFAGHCAGQQGLAGPGRAVKKYPLGRFDPQSLEHLGMLQGQLDHLAHAADLFGQSSQILVGHARGGLHGPLPTLDGNAGLRVNEHHALPWDRVGDGEVLGVGSEEVRAHGVAGPDGQTLQQPAEIP